MRSSPQAWNKAVVACRRAADLLMGYRWKLWFWGDSIGTEGLLDASELTGDGKYAAFVYGLFKGWIPKMENRSRFEHTAPGAALVRSYLLTHDPNLLSASRGLAAYLNSFRKTRTGCPIHYEDVEFDLPPERPSTGRAVQRWTLPGSKGPTGSGPCVFVDSVHFQGPFLAALYSATGETRYLEQAKSTIGPQIDLLWDKDEHLFHHFWMEKTEKRNGVFWGRGNCWGMLGLIHTLEHLPRSDPLARRLKEILALQAAMIAGLQDKSGDWHTVLEDPASYLESSIAAFVVSGFSTAIKQLWLPSSYQKVVERAWRAMWGHLRPDGLFDGVSYETHPSLSPEHYRNMPRGAMVPWGQGPFLAACRAYLGQRAPNTVK